jgi:hypothetical protein
MGDDSEASKSEDKSVDMSDDDRLEDDPNAKSSKAMFNMESNPSIEKDANMFKAEESNTSMKVTGKTGKELKK